MCVCVWMGWCDCGLGNRVCTHAGKMKYVSRTLLHTCMLITLCIHRLACTEAHGLELARTKALQSMLLTRPPAGPASSCCLGPSAAACLRSTYRLALLRCFAVEHVMLRGAGRLRGGGVCGQMLLPRLVGAMGRSGDMAAMLQVCCPRLRVYDQCILHECASLLWRCSLHRRECTFFMDGHCRRSCEQLRESASCVVPSAVVVVGC